jgi:hypothetical protein
LRQTRPVPGHGGPRWCPGVHAALRSMRRSGVGRSGRLAAEPGGCTSRVGHVLPGTTAVSGQVELGRPRLRRRTACRGAGDRVGEASRCSGWHASLKATSTRPASSSMGLGRVRPKATSRASQPTPRDHLRGHGDEAGATRGTTARRSTASGRSRLDTVAGGVGGVSVPAVRDSSRRRSWPRRAIKTARRRRLPCVLPDAR